METLPSVPGGNFERSSWAYCAAFFCTFLAPKSSFERWLPCFFLLLCFAASSGANGAKATRMASTADICFRKLVFIFLFWKEPYCVPQRRDDVYHRLGLYPETAQPGSRKRLTGGSLLSSSWVALLAKPFLQRERPHCDCLPGSRLPFPVVVYAALRAWHFTTTRRSDTRQSHRCHTCTSYACRHRPTAQT